MLQPQTKPSKTKPQWLSHTMYGYSIAYAVRHVLCPDGKRRYATLHGEPTTVWTRDATVAYKGRTVNGFIVCDHDEVVFHPYVMKTNGKLFPFVTYYYDYDNEVMTISLDKEQPEGTLEERLASIPSMANIYKEMSRTGCVWFPNDSRKHDGLYSVLVAPHWLMGNVYDQAKCITADTRRELYDKLRQLPTLTPADFPPERVIQLYRWQER